MATKKTTLMLDEGVYGDIRKRAAERGQSVSSIVAEALTAYLAQRDAFPQKRIKLTIASSGDWIDPRNPMSNHELFDMLDEDVPLDKLR